MLWNFSESWLKDIWCRNSSESWLKDTCWRDSSESWLKDICFRDSSESSDDDDQPPRYPRIEISNRFIFHSFIFFYSLLSLSFVLLFIWNSNLLYNWYICASMFFPKGKNCKNNFNDIQRVIKLDAHKSKVSKDSKENIVKHNLVPFKILKR